MKWENSAMLDNAEYTELTNLDMSSSEIVSLLEDIRGKLDDNNDLLREISEKLGSAEDSDSYGADTLF